jgi:hypothetical protein
MRSIILNAAKPDAVSVPPSARIPARSIGFSIALLVLLNSCNTATLQPDPLIQPTEPPETISTASDNFMRDNGTLGPNWTPITIGAGIQLINHAYASGSGSQTGFPTTFALWNQNTFAADQLTSAQVSAIAPHQSTVSITAATQSGSNTTYTYTLTAGAALLAPQEMITTGMTNAKNNGVFLISSLGSGTFTVANASGVTESGSTGTGVSPTDDLNGTVNRGTLDGQNGYFYFVGNNSAWVAYNDGSLHDDNRVYVYELWKIVGGRFTFLSGMTRFTTIPDTAGDVFKLLTVGSKIALFKNNVLKLHTADNSLVNNAYTGVDVVSATGAGNTIPLGTNNGVSGTQWTNWTATDLPTTNSGWARRDEETFETPLSGPKWTANTGFPSLIIGNGTGSGNPGQACSGVHTGRTWAANHSSQVMLYSVTGKTSTGLLVRAETTLQDFYMAQMVFTNGFGATSFNIQKYVSGTSTQLGSSVAGTTSIFDIIRFEVNGNALNLYQNGMLVMTRTDSTFTNGGGPGLLANGNTVNWLWWSGDEFTGGAGGGSGP